MLLNLTGSEQVVNHLEMSKSTRNESEIESGYLESSPALQTFFAIILTLSAVAGIFGNILIILTVAMTKALRIPSNVFIVNLAVADLLITTVVDPFNVVGAFVGPSYFEENNAVCQMVASLCAPACLCSILSICAISLNRYILICHYHRYEEIFTWYKTGLMCLVLWFISYCMHFPSHVGWGHNVFDAKFYICTFSIATYSYTLFYISLGVFVPMAVILFSYVSIFKKYWQVKKDIRDRQNISLQVRNEPNMELCISKSEVQVRLKVPLFKQRNGYINSDSLSFQESRNGSDNSLRKLRRSRKGFTGDDIKLAKTLFTVFVAFLVCWAPFSLLVLMKQPEFIPGWIYMIAIIMAHGNSSINSILYGLTNERFRQGYRTVLGLERQTSSKVKVGGASRYHSPSPSLNGSIGAALVFTNPNVAAAASVIRMEQENNANSPAVTSKSTTSHKKKKLKNNNSDSGAISVDSQMLSPNGIIIFAPDLPPNRDQ